MVPNHATHHIKAMKTDSREGISKNVLLSTQVNDTADCFDTLQN